jgi:hypothetical protein
LGIIRSRGSPALWVELSQINISYRLPIGKSKRGLYIKRNYSELMLPIGFLYRTWGLAEAFESAGLQY